MKRIATGIILLAVATVCGCIEREMTITSEPDGALVYVSDVEVGRTPVTIPFTWYGDYDIVLRREGYETLNTHANIQIPANQIPPLDFFLELAPWTIYDRRYLHFRMEEAKPVSDEQLIERADALRQRNLEPVPR